MLTEITYPQLIENALKKIESILLDEADHFLAQNSFISRRSLLLLILQKDEAIWEDLILNISSYGEIECIIKETQEKLGKSITEAIAFTRQKIAQQIEDQVLHYKKAHLVGKV